MRKEINPSYTNFKIFAVNRYDLEQDMKIYEFERIGECPDCKRDLYKTHIIVGEDIVVYCVGCGTTWIARD